MARIPSAIAALACLWLSSASDATSSGGECLPQLRQAVRQRANALPPACRAIGPVRLGMSKAQVTKELGRPDLDPPGSAPYTTLDYIYPRDLGQQLRRRPVPPGQLRHTDVAVTLFHDRVIAIGVTDGGGKGFPFSYAAIRLGDPATALTRQLGQAPELNASRDSGRYEALPLSFDIDTDHKTVAGVFIAEDWNAVSKGQRMRFNLVQAPGSGLVRDFRLSVDPSAR